MTNEEILKAAQSSKEDIHLKSFGRMALQALPLLVKQILLIMVIITRMIMTIVIEMTVTRRRRHLRPVIIHLVSGCLY